jgi:hypothetical protein
MNSKYRLRTIRLSAVGIAALAGALESPSAATADRADTALSESGGARCRIRLGCGDGLEAASVDRVEDIDTVVIVAMPADFPIGSVMRADCDFVQRVEFTDGAARETQQCTLSDDPVMVPENQGVAPAVAFRHHQGPCEWMSDYWYAVDESTVYAESARLVVTPGGTVFATSVYPAEPLDCE